MDLICIHWGSVDAPDMTPFNGNPQVLFDKIINPKRIKVLAPGEKYTLGYVSHSLGVLQFNLSLSPSNSP